MHPNDQFFLVILTNLFLQCMTQMSRALLILCPVLIYLYTANSKKVVLQKPSTLNSKRARDDGCCYLEPRSGQFTLVNKQIYTLSVFMICPGIVTM